MEICLVTNTLDPGTGLGRMVSNIARELESGGHKIGFILGTGTTRNDFINIDFQLNKSNPYLLIKNLLSVRKFSKRYKYIVCYDVVPAGILVSAANLGRKNKIVIHALGSYSLFSQKSKLKNILISWVFKNSFRVFLINKFVEKKIQESNKFFSFSSNVAFVPVGVEPENFLRKLNDLPIIQGDYIISVGAIKKRKGQLEVLKAFSKVKKSYINLKYIIVGSTKDSPSYYQEMLSFIDKENLSENVHFIEDVSDEQLINLYTYSQFFILTPISTDTFIEGFGMVYIESALCGKTSIGTLDSGAEAAIEHMETGLLVKNDPECIAESILVLLENISLRKKLEDNAQIRAISFDWKNVVDLYEIELK